MTPRRAARPLSWRWFLIFALLFCAQVLPRLTEDSPAGDEPIDIVNGLYDWRGDVATVDLHPPLAQALQALPLWVLGLRPPAGAQAQEYVARDLSFLFETHSKNWPTFFFFPRLVTCLFGLGIGFLLYRMSREESPAFMICALGFWAFDPAILAFSGLAMADVPMAFFFLLSVWFFHRSLEQGRGRLAGWAGLFGAMAVTCKFSAFFLLPVLACLEWAQWREGRSAFRRMFQRWGWGLGAALVWVILVYLPGTVVIPGHPWPLHFLFSDFQLMPILMRHPDYFLGKLVSGGQLGYYPLAFVLKTPLSLLVFLALAFALAAARKIQIPTWHWIPAPVFFLEALPFHHLGIRNLMPVYPFCFLAAARAGEWMWHRRPKKSLVFPALLAGLLAFQALSVGLCFPSQISYFNELVPRDRKIYWLGDSNLDIGQDTQRLAREAKRRGWTHVKLAYMGIADPAWYGMDWQPWTQKDLKGPQAGWVYAINAEFIQMGPAYDSTAPAILNSWIHQAPPSGRVGDTWLYYEVPGTPGADASPQIHSAPYFPKRE